MILKTKPLAHQRRCLDLHGAKPAFALTAEMGTGKTWIMLINLALLYEQRQCDAAIVFAPNGVHTNWVRLELPKHMPNDIPWKAIAWNTKASTQKAIVKFIGSTFGLRILTMNWEALATAKGFMAAQKFCASAKHLAIICDESDEVKNPRAIRTKSLMKLRGYSKWRRIMTGTPFDGTPYPAFSQYNFLDPSILLCNNYAAFKATYAEMLSPTHPKLVAIMKKHRLRFAPQIEQRDGDGRVKYRNLGKLSELIAPYTFRVMKKDCLDLPEKVYKSVLFDLTPEQRRHYERAQREFRLEFEGDATPIARLTVAGKLAQITSGYYLHPHSQEPIRIDGKNPKLDLLRKWVQMIRDEGNQAIIWARYTVQIHDIVAALREDEHVVVTYYGETSGEDRATAIDDFQSGKAGVFVGNQQAGGTGITLTAANYVIYFSNTFRLRDRLQSEDRAHRIGQTKSVTYINFAAEGTVDEDVVRAILNKQDVSELIQSGAIQCA